MLGLNSSRRICPEIRRSAALKADASTRIGLLIADRSGEAVAVKVILSGQPACGLQLVTREQDRELLRLCAPHAIDLQHMFRGAGKSRKMASDVIREGVFGTFLT